MPKLATVLRHSCQYMLFVAPVHVVVLGWLGGGECAGFNWSLESDWKCRCCSQKKWNLIDWSIFKGGNVRKSSKHINVGKQMIHSWSDNPTIVNPGTYVQLSHRQLSDMPWNREHRKRSSSVPKRCTTCNWSLSTTWKPSHFFVFNHIIPSIQLS